MVCAVNVLMSDLLDHSMILNHNRKAPVKTDKRSVMEGLLWPNILCF